MTIIADSNENWGHGFPMQQLSCGDFVVTGEHRGFIIERKEWTDFISSYRSGSLFNQLGRCLSQQERKGRADVEYEVILLIEGQRKNAIHYANASNYEIRRVLSSIVAKMDIKLLFSRSRNETADYVEDLNEWLTDRQTGGPHSIRETEKVPKAKRAQYILEGLPGVGPSTALALEDHFGSVRTVMTATEEELQEVEGIGPATASKIVNAIT